MKIEAKATPARSKETEEILSLLDDARAYAEGYLEDGTPPYAIMQQISSQISRAQSGHGPFRDRFKDIAIMAIAGILQDRR